MKARELYEKAHEAGMKAGNEVGVRPMIVGSPTTAFGSDIDYSKKTYVVESGVCGFAGVVIKPARGKFVAFLKENDYGNKHYYGGYRMGCLLFGQSLTRKEAYCEAFAKVLGEEGIRCYVDSRMD